LPSWNTAPQGYATRSTPAFNAGLALLAEACNTGTGVNDKGVNGHSAAKL
jgi:hypothetical protein